MRHLVVSPALLLASVSPVLATPFTINTSTDTTGKTVNGNDTGSVAAGAALSTTGVSITWSGASNAPGVVIDNSGTISSSANRAFNTSGSDTARNLTFNNNAGALLSGFDDALRINAQVGDSSVVINNSGRIFSSTGQAIDFAAISSAGANVKINNNAGGVMEAPAHDGVRAGMGSTVTNSGLICAGSVSGGNCSGGIIGESSDGVDWQGNSGTLINNGVISGQRHGTTSDLAVNVTNNAGALLLGRNGSGVGSDGTGTVINRGTIRGASDGLAANGDGDGVDIDLQANITNFGIIEGTSAAGVGSDGLVNTAEGVAMGGGTVDNKAGARITGGATGMLVDNSSLGGATLATTVTNAGRIEGLNGDGIRLIGDQADTITNSGVIAGTAKAIDMGGGDDLLKLATGSLIQGLNDGGAGVDTIDVLSSVTLGDSINYERYILQTGAILTLGADIVTVESLLGALINGNTISNIIGNGHDFYYYTTDANAYLDKRTYNLTGGGQLIAVSEPMSAAVLVSALLGLAAVARRRRGESPAVKVVSAA